MKYSIILMKYNLPLTRHYVEEVDPTAEFDSRLIAEEFNQSLFLEEDTDGIEEVI